MNPAFPDRNPPPDASWITFLSRRTGSNLLYRMRPDGSECKPVFGGPVNDAPGLGTGLSLERVPHWTWQSPDRKYFASCAYEVLRPQSKDGRFHWDFSLHLGPADGSGPTRIIAPVCQEALAWSPDGKRVAYTVTSSLDPEDRYAARMSRVFIAAIDGTNEELILERPGVWEPADWSPDGKKLLLAWLEHYALGASHSVLLELDIAHAEGAVRRSQQRSGSQRRQKGNLNEVLRRDAPVEAEGGRYSPDGKSIAVTAFSKSTMLSESQALDYELGVIDRANATYEKIAWYKDGLRGPICWSPDGTEILFSRPLAEGDKREGGREEPGALRQEWGLGLWAIKPDGTGERFVTTGWSPDWR